MVLKKEEVANLSKTDTQKVMLSVGKDKLNEIINSPDDQAIGVLTGEPLPEPSSEGTAAPAESGANGETTPGTKQEAAGEAQSEEQSGGEDKPKVEAGAEDSTTPEIDESDTGIALEKYKTHAEKTRQENLRLGNELGDAKKQLAASQLLVDKILNNSSKLGITTSENQNEDGNGSDKIAEASKTIRNALGDDVGDAFDLLVDTKITDKSHEADSRTEQIRQFREKTKAAITEEYPDFETRIPVIVELAKAEGATDADIQRFTANPYDISLTDLKLWATKVELLAEKSRKTPDVKEVGTKDTDKIVDNIKKAALSSVASSTGSVDRKTGKSKIDISKLTKADVNSKTDSAVLDEILSQPG